MSSTPSRSTGQQPGNYTCQQCGAVFNTPDELNNHNRQAHQMGQSGNKM